MIRESAEGRRMTGRRAVDERVVRDSAEGPAVDAGRARFGRKANA